MESQLFQYKEQNNPIGKFVIWLGILTFIFLPILFFTLVFQFFYSDSPHPSDEELIKNFQANEADFEKLKQMAQEDSNLTRIAYDFKWIKESEVSPRPNLEKDLSEKRWNEYRDLFNRLNLEMGIYNNQPNDIWLLASTRGLVTGGSSKGYIHLIEKPSPIVESLDEPNFDRPEFKGRHTLILYKKLKDNWYLYYEVN